MTEIFTAKTVDEAKALAARHFGASQEDISFEILEEPKKGLFRMKGDARVRATYISVSVSMEETAPAVVDTALEEIPEKIEPAVSEPAPETVPVQEEQEVQEVQAEMEASTEAESVPEKEETPAQKTDDDLSDEQLVRGEPSPRALEKIERAKTYLLSVLEKMGVSAEIRVNAGAESAILDIVAPDNGMVIGRRGETLDALQYLTFMIANRGDREYYRIILNSAGYRDRRRKTLEELAAKVARNVLKSGRQTTLEPRNPYERRIIHSAVSRIEGVSSRSIGEEPYRKVVISSLKPRRSRRPQEGGRSDRPERRNNRDRRRDRRGEEVAATRTSMDFMKTSFEKDYKRPKPEDDIHAGLYGKIEF